MRWSPIVRVTRGVTALTGQSRRIADSAVARPGAATRTTEPVMSYVSTVPVAPAAIVPGITRFLERVLAATVEARRRSIAHRQYRHLLESRTTCSRTPASAAATCARRCAASSPVAGTPPHSSLPPFRRTCRHEASFQLPDPDQSRCRSACRRAPPARRWRYRGRRRDVGAFFDTPPPTCRHTGGDLADDDRRCPMRPKVLQRCARIRDHGRDRRARGLTEQAPGASR